MARASSRSAARFQVQLDDLARASADEEQLADIGATRAPPGHHPVEFFIGIGEASEIALLDDRGGETRLGKHHHARCRLQQVRTGARADNEKRRPESCGAARRSRSGRKKPRATANSVVCFIDSALLLTGSRQAEHEQAGKERENWDAEARQTRHLRKCSNYLGRSTGAYHPNLGGSRLRAVPELVAEVTRWSSSAPRCSTPIQRWRRPALIAFCSAV